MQQPAAEEQDDFLGGRRVPQFFFRKLNRFVKEGFVLAYLGG